MSEEMKREESESRPRPIRPMRGGRGMPVPKGAIKKGTLPRLIKTVFKYYKWQLIVALICIVINSTGFVGIFTNAHRRRNSRGR